MRRDDMLRYYGDSDVQAFATRHGWALLLPFHCGAKSGTDGDMNMDPSKGLGRALRSTDRITGTQRPYAYFRKYFDRGASWTFVVQNKTPHCCVINAKTLMPRSGNP
jgi:hypothetical protein